MRKKYNIAGITFEIAEDIENKVLAKFEVTNSCFPCFTIFVETEKKAENIDIEKLSQYNLPSSSRAYTCKSMSSGSFYVMITNSLRNHVIVSLANHCHYRVLMSINDLNEKISFLRDITFVALVNTALYHNVLCIHASCVKHRDQCYLFLGPCGRGKSTHAKLWVDNIADTELINDDKPFVAVENGEVLAYGSPWSGKTRCYKNKSCKLGGIVMLNRGKNNEIQRVNTLRAMSILTPCIIGVNVWDVASVKQMNLTLKHIIELVPVYDLWCTATPNAAKVCYDAIVNI